VPVTVVTGAVGAPVTAARAITGEATPPELTTGAVPVTGRPRVFASIPAALGEAAGTAATGTLELPRAASGFSVGRAPSIFAPSALAVGVTPPMTTGGTGV